MSERERQIGFEQGGKKGKRAYILNADHKRFIIGRAAAQDSHEQIAIALLEKFDLEITRQGIAYFLSRPKTKKMVVAATAQFGARILDIPIANKSVRLHRLESLFQTALTGVERLVKTPFGMERVKLPDLRLATKILQAAMNEIGEKEEKLADAIKQMGGDTHYHFDINYAELPEGERDRKTREWVNAWNPSTGIGGHSRF